MSNFLELLVKLVKILRFCVKLKLFLSHYSGKNTSVKYTSLFNKYLMQNLLDLRRHHFHWSLKVLRLRKRLSKHLHYYAKHNLTLLLYSSECFVWFVFLFLYFYSEPVSARAPTFPTSASSYNYDIEAGSGGSVLCQAQGYPQPMFRWVSQFSTFYNIIHRHTILEPIGAKAPSFSTDSKGSIFFREIGQNFALLCQAQASPIPIYR